MNLECKAMLDEDIELMLEFKKGDVSAFKELMGRYETRLLNFIYRFVGSKTDAEDLAQEVFLRVYKARDRYEPKAKFSTWLYKIATNLCINYKKRQKKITIPLDKIVTSDGEEIIREIPDPYHLPPDVSAEKEETNQKIRSILFSLPEIQRVALILCIYEEKSYDEISKILHRSIPSIKFLLFRARKNLRDKLLLFV